MAAVAGSSEGASSAAGGAEGGVAPGIQLNVPMEDIEMERAVTSVGDVAAMAAAMEQQLMQVSMGGIWGQRKKIFVLKLVLS